MKQNHKKRSHAWRLFLLQVSLVVAIFAVVLYIGVFQRDKTLVRRHILADARTQIDGIILTRLWNSMYGGVYVEKKPGVESNPFLTDPDVVTRDGRTFTLRNPAIMTREISKLRPDDNHFAFNLTSLRPLNPGNRADDFERAALLRFEAGESEAYVEEKRGDRTFFRYMIPLVTTAECLQCHAAQGYAEGDVRGGISLAMDITAFRQAMTSNHILGLGLIAAATAVVLACFYYFSIRLMRQLKQAQQSLAEMAVTDELTGLANRRRFFERLEEEMDRALRYGSDLPLIMLDIDHFKRVNDTFGHPVGDTVLAEVARLLTANLRTSDIVARYGGEEFAVLIPGMDANEAARAAEKLRVVMEVNDLFMDGPSIKVTVSAGVAALKSLPAARRTRDQLIRSADQALYRAKGEGRNRVCIHRPETASQPSLI
jgi:diguanylate cyclase (GGDEF)-like protein